MRLLRRAPLVAASLVGLAVVTGCSDDPTSSPPVVPLFYSAQVDSNPNNTISAVVTIMARGADSASIRFWTGAGAVQNTPRFPFNGDTVLQVPVFGLDTVATYSLEVHLENPGSSVVSDTLTFTSGSLPAWIPLPTAQGTDTTPGYLLLSYPNGPVIVSNTAQVLWYRYQPGGVLGSWQAQLNGAYTWLGTTDSSGYYLFDALGNTAGRLGCVGFKTRFHDVLVLPGGDAWIMCDEDQLTDLTPYGGLDSTTITATVVQHLSAGGQVVFQWRSLDHFLITDAPAVEYQGTHSVNFTHGNGIALDDDGNLLLSSRTLSEITKINTTTGAVIWRFGGLANQFTFVNDPKGGFERQHGLRFSAPGEIQFLDNGLFAPSRLVRFQIDATALTATLVMAFEDSPTTYTNVGGSTQRYTNGHSLVSFGRAGRVVEVDSAGNRAWELTGIDNVYVFRAQRLASLYTAGLGELTR